MAPPLRDLKAMASNLRAVNCSTAPSLSFSTPISALAVHGQRAYERKQRPHRRATPSVRGRVTSVGGAVQAASLAWRIQPSSDVTLKS